MDTTGFFDYPTEPSAPTEHGLPGFLSGRGEDDWAMLLDHSETRLFAPGELVLKQGEQDRALYLLVDGLGEGAVAASSIRSRRSARARSSTARRAPSRSRR